MLAALSSANSNSPYISNVASATSLTYKKTPPPPYSCHQQLSWYLTFVYRSTKQIPAGLSVLLHQLKDKPFCLVIESGSFSSFLPDIVSPWGPWEGSQIHWYETAVQSDRTCCRCSCLWLLIMRLNFALCCFIEQIFRKLFAHREIQRPQEKKDKCSSSFYAPVTTEKDSFKYSFSLQISLHGFEGDKGIAFKWSV